MSGTLCLHADSRITRPVPGDRSKAKNCSSAMGARGAASEKRTWTSAGALPRKEPELSPSSRSVLDFGHIVSRSKKSKLTTTYHLREIARGSRSPNPGRWRGNRKTRGTGIRSSGHRGGAREEHVSCCTGRRLHAESALQFAGWRSSAAVGGSLG